MRVRERERNSCLPEGQAKKIEEKIAAPILKALLLIHKTSSNIRCCRKKGNGNSNTSNTNTINNHYNTISPALPSITAIQAAYQSSTIPRQLHTAPAAVGTTSEGM